MRAGAKLADNCASIWFSAFGKLDERRADPHYVSLNAEQVRDASTRRRRYLDDRLVCLDGNERLIGDDVIAFVDIPGDDLCLLKTFSEIRQHELAHGTKSVDIQLNWQASRAALTMRSTDGI